MYRIEINKRRMVNRIHNKKKNIFVRVLSDYCTSSTLHGIGYVGAKDTSLLEKIWWMIMFLLSVAVCSYVINKTWMKWKDNPVILSFDQKLVSISNIPFPAVTVCPLNKIIQIDYNYTKMFINREKLRYKELKTFCDLSLMCKVKHKGTFPCTADVTDKSVIDKIRKFAPGMDIFVKVVWQNRNIEFSNFAAQITEEGLCYTFNTFNQQDMYTKHLDHSTDYIRLNLSNEGWSLEDGYPQNTNKLDTHPRISVNDGTSSGLSIGLLTYSINSDYVCGMPLYGFKIMLHNPAENPKTSQQYYFININQKYSMAITPQLTTTSQSLRNVSPHTRKCYFANEKYLKFFKAYTQNNCRVECTANITRQYCGCVPFHMPKDINTAICGYGSLGCVNYVEDAVLNFEVLKDVSEIPNKERNNLKYAYDIFTQCNCLPSCTNLQFKAETSQTNSHIRQRYAATNYFEDRSKEDRDHSFNEDSPFALTITEVEIYYKESQFYALRRSALYEQIDFLSNCGGLLGLFMGFSLLSLIEIVYFSTIRFWFKYKNRQ